MRNGQITRVLALMRTLAAERRTLSSLAKDFSVTTRTIRRDIAALEDAGMPVCKTSESDDASASRLWWISSIQRYQRISARGDRE